MDRTVEDEVGVVPLVVYLTTDHPAPAVQVTGKDPVKLALAVQEGAPVGATVSTIKLLQVDQDQLFPKAS